MLYEQDDMIAFLLTHDFNENHSKNEYVGYLDQYRYEYRLLKAKNDSLKNITDAQQSEIERISIELKNKTVENINLHNLYRNTVENMAMKLTLWERLTGRKKMG
jgi:hypothetical protein